MKEVTAVNPEKKSGPDKYEIESAHRTLMDAHRLKKDPKMMKHVLAHAKVHGEVMKELEEMAGTHAKKKPDSLDDIRGKVAEMDEAEKE